MMVSCCACDRMFDYADVIVGNTITCSICHAVIEIIQVDANHNLARTRYGSIITTIDTGRTITTSSSSIYTMTDPGGNVGIGPVSDSTGFHFTSGDNTYIVDPNATLTWSPNAPVFQTVTPDTQFVINTPGSEYPFTFHIHDKEIMRVDGTGNFYVNGNLVTNDKDVYNALVAFLSGAGALNRSLTPDQNIIVHGDPLTGGLSRYEIAKKDSTS